MVKRFGEEEIIQLTNRDNLSGEAWPQAVDNKRLYASLRDAQNLIHGYLARRYTLPLTPVPHLAVRWSCDLARWFLQSHSAPEQVKDNYERTLAELREAATGDLVLDSEELGFRNGAAEIVGPGQTFTNNDMKGF